MSAFSSWPQIDFDKNCVFKKIDFLKGSREEPGKRTDRTFLADFDVNQRDPMSKI